MWYLVFVHASTAASVPSSHCPPALTGLEDSGAFLKQIADIVVGKWIFLFVYKIYLLMFLIYDLKLEKTKQKNSFSSAVSDFLVERVQ